MWLFIYLLNAYLVGVHEDLATLFGVVPKGRGELIHSQQLIPNYMLLNN